MTTTQIKQMLTSYNTNGYRFAYISDNNKKIILTKRDQKEYTFSKIIILISEIADNIEWMTEHGFTESTEN